MAAETQSTNTLVESSETSDYKQKYKTLKRKLKGLVYEHEMLAEQLEKTQKKLLRVAKDRSFLLDRILQYEKCADSSSDSEATDLSDSDTEKPVSKKKQATPSTQQDATGAPPEESQEAGKKTPKAKQNKKTKPANVKKTPPMTIEDIERHLDSRPSLPSIEKATSSMPADIFNNVESEGTSDNENDTGLVIDMK